MPKNAGGKRPDTSPVVCRAASQQRGQLAKGGQALQVPAVALYPSRKKVPVKDLPPFGKWMSIFMKPGIQKYILNVYLLYTYFFQATTFVLNIRTSTFFDAIERYLYREMCMSLCKSVMHMESGL